MDGSVWVILPTYDEAENLEAVVRGVRAAAPEACVLVVDDASPDGTGALADALAAADPQVAVLHRAGKHGLGRAYTAGFAHALAAGAEYVVEMDADLSHDPADLPRLLAPARAGADLVLGSRYVPGGGVENWDLERRVLSRAGCGFARRVLGVGVHDLTGGFKCFRANALRAIDAPSAGAQGYAFQVEITWRVLALGLTVVEVPIRFRERRLGASKMSLPIALEAAWLVPALRWGPRRWRPLAAPGVARPAILCEASCDPEEPMAENITDVTDNSFQAEVLENDTPVLVDFWAPWCGPCRIVAPALEEIAGEREDLRVVKLNVDDNQQTAAQYQVLAIPTMILFRNGQEAKRIQGAMPKKRIEAELEPALA